MLNFLRGIYKSSEFLLLDMDTGYLEWLRRALPGATVSYISVGRYNKTCVKRPLKKDKIKILLANGSLMKVKSIAECSAWIILQYF